MQRACTVGGAVQGRRGRAGARALALLGRLGLPRLQPVAALAAASPHNGAPSQCNHGSMHASAQPTGQSSGHCPPWRACAWGVMRWTPPHAARTCPAGRAPAQHIAPHHQTPCNAALLTCICPTGTQRPPPPGRSQSCSAAWLGRRLQRCRPCSGFGTLPCRPALLLLQVPLPPLVRLLLPGCRSCWGWQRAERRSCLNRRRAPRGSTAPSAAPAAAVWQEQQSGLLMHYCTSVHCMHVRRLSAPK